jgi:hypothetical protein
MSAATQSRRYRRKLLPQEHDRYIKALSETGNVTLAAERVGRDRSTFIKLCARDKAFAARCGAAVAEFRLSALRKGPSTIRSSRNGPPPREISGRSDGALKSARGELVLVHGKRRPAQIRRAGGGELTQAGIDVFLKTLAATANVRLAAESVGVWPNAIRNRRLRDPAFDQAVRDALKIGYDRLEAALVESAMRAFDDGDPETAGTAELPAMTVDQAFMLFVQHRRTCRDGWASKRAEHQSASNAEIAHALERRLKNWRPPE